MHYHLSYDGDCLSSVENPDTNRLRYTYDNDFLTTVANFEGEVYVENTYDHLDHVTRWYI